MQPRLYALNLSLLVASLPAQSQSLGYLDAETPMGAVSMLKVTLRTAEYMKARCESVFPEKSRSMDIDLTIWKNTEARAIAKTEALWPTLTAKEPEFETMASHAVETVGRQIEAMLNMPGGRGLSVFEEVCDKYFPQLASGIWRRRTPKAYEYIDQLP